MSKPISFGFGKQKPSPSFSSSGLASRKTPTPRGPPKTALRNDSDNEDEDEPRHESVTGFTSSGAILSESVQETTQLVIKNPGNSDWRRRGRKNLLPAEVQAQQQGGGPVTVERDEVSKESGLQLADKTEQAAEPNGDDAKRDTTVQADTEPAPKQLTADEEALQALLDNGTGKPKSNAVIVQQGNTQLSIRDEIEDFRDDVAARPDPCTLEEYAAMPVEEFGLAMLRGMGQKRRANGEIINLDSKPEDNPRKLRKQEGFLGIGAKAAPGTDVELGAWGKADMRKNAKGQGFFTPLMRVNKVTGERISEEELQKRIKESNNVKEDDNWKSTRDHDSDSNQNGHRDSRGHRAGDDYRDQMNSFSRPSSSKRDRDDRDYSHSKGDREDRDYESSNSRRRDERSRDGRSRDPGDYDRGHRDKHRDRRRDDDRYDSKSSSRTHRDRDRDRDRERDRDRDTGGEHRYRERR
ncbi:hypothetical protein ABEF95_003755 [Exophiala dermatitidis]